MASLKIKKGFDINLDGAPSTELVEAISSPEVTVYPQEFPGIKPRLLVKQGDQVSRGSVLFTDKKNEAFKFRSPAGGTIKSIVLGPRRSLQEIIVEVSAPETVESFTKYDSAQIAQLSREAILDHLQETGYLSLVRERPFSGIANPAVTPKSIFVNGMNSAPYQPTLENILQDEEASFQAGLDVLGRLTGGKTHLVVAEGTPVQANGVEVHTVSGPHPAGNTSVHIHHLDPITPGQHVWTAQAQDVVLLGKLFLTGEVASTKIISVSGPGVAEEARKHYRVRMGGTFKSVFNGHINSGEHRVISGDLLGGQEVARESGIRFYDHAIVVIPEGRERHFIGWLSPGLNKFSRSPLYLSRWLKGGAKWKLNTNENGSHRAMVLTGLYDTVMPMRIKVDYLVRAVLAHDTEEAVQLGLLETAPEDFALCSFICPSKMDVVKIIRDGLAEVEEEGL